MKKKILALKKKNLNYKINISYNLTRIK
ncbi:Hypothetical protein KK9_0424 [Borreliella garinii BgVir]|uniref:Uncharacterized protein n=1 Tax=Borrelia garinii subsp. bavariensis (strain ATCC BAA-2496 / DSM 23469 / PBi) TaxID=290434 RepID=A0A7I6GWA1_BORGP|nr:hypothetical protein BG0417 [Borreliella bavariensis PBi]AEW68752.1 Hypothetical protein KK9_0424 [Borreliella garinii BgVir]